MSGSAGPPGNSGHDWLALVKQTADHALNLRELAPPVGPDYEPSQEKADHLYQVDTCLRDILAHAENVRRHILGSDFEKRLARPLDVFSGSVRAAGLAVEDLRISIEYDLRKQANEAERHKYRSAKQYLADHREIRDLSVSAKDRLDEVLGHMDVLIKRLR
jgi:hypothetical protein